MELIRTIIVEDEYLVRMGLKMVIDWEQYGFQIVGEAKDGVEGIKLYQEFKPQLIITDIKMPHKTGLEMMREIRNYDKNVKFIVISAYDQFEYAKQSIESGVLKYCLKGSMMDTEIVHILEEIKNKIIPNSESGNRYFSDFSEATETEIFCKDNCFRSLCVSKASDQMVQNINQHFDSEKISYIYTIKHQYVYWIIGGNDHIRVERILTNIPLQREEEYLGVSTEFKTCKEYTKYMNEAYFANRIHVISEKNKNFYQDIPETYHTGDIIQEVKKINDFLSVEKYDEVVAQLENIQKKILKIGSVYLFHKVIYKLIGIIAEYNNTIVEKTLYEELIDLEDYNAIFMKIKDYVEQERTENQKSSDDRKYVKRVKNYIGQHYSENIKMKELAELIHLSPNYLGKTFYAETNQYLSEYINEIRLEKAKMLLESGIYPVGEVGIMVGIGDPYYFSKIFKKHYGVSPKEYTRGKF